MSVNSYLTKCNCQSVRTLFYRSSPRPCLNYLSGVAKDGDGGKIGRLLFFRLPTAAACGCTKHFSRAGSSCLQF